VAHLKRPSINEPGAGLCARSIGFLVGFGIPDFFAADLARTGFRGGGRTTRFKGGAFETDLTEVLMTYFPDELKSEPFINNGLGCHLIPHCSKKRGGDPIG
jgi:hypothetical protein